MYYLERGREPQAGVLHAAQAENIADNSVAEHAAEADPHPGYLTSAEGNAAYDALGAAAAAVAAHEAAADPHTGYQKESEKGAANGYASLGAGGLVPIAQLASGTPDGTKFVRDDGTLQIPAGGSGNPLDAWPIGSVFIAVVSTSPATLLGGGTWSAFATGRMLVGIDGGDTDFDTVEETGGAKTVSLTAAQSGLPQHTHTQNSHNHTQDAHAHVEQTFGTTTGGSAGLTRDTSMSGSAVAVDVSTATAVATNQAATATNQDAGPSAAAEAHPNLPPYIVVYMWKRTA